MAKRFKLRFDKVIPSFLLCRSKHPHLHYSNPTTSSIESKSFDISYPIPPPSTPIDDFNECAVHSTESNDGDVSSTSPLLAKKRIGRRKGATFKSNGVVRSRFSSSSGDSGWFSSDEDQKQLIPPHSRNFSNRKSTALHTKSDKASTFGTKSGVMESVAIEKKSEDPYTDFKKSMMEMIVEKGIIEVRDLEDLLQCFLTLNSREHHLVIVEAFTAIWNALFSQSPFERRRFVAIRNSEAQMP